MLDNQRRNSMDDDIYDLWLKDTGLRRWVPVPDGSVLADNKTAEPQPTVVNDLDLVDPEDDEDGADRELRSAEAAYRDNHDRWENTELVAAAFRAAGNPKFEDVRLKSARTSDRPAPTHRELALQRAKRVSGSVEW